MRIVFCASEVYPFAKTGGLADVCGALPLALEKLGVDVEIFMPLYRSIDRQKYGLVRGDNGVWHTIIGNNVEVHFIEHNDFFNRDGIYSGVHGDFRDNLDRFLFLCNRTLELLKERGRPVSVIHCHDWHTSLIPIILRERLRSDPFFQKTKTVLTIHNLAYQGIFSKNEYHKLHLPGRLFHWNMLEFFGQMNLLKGGIIAADEVTTVSPQYAEEIQTRQYGHGLEGVLKHNRKKIIGIINGLDYGVWNPETDIHVPVPFSIFDFNEKKKRNKQYLQKRIGLPVREDIPLFGFVGRLSYQKGVDLIVNSLWEIMKMDVQVIIQGVGEGKYYHQLMDAAHRYPDKMRLYFEFGEPLAHQIYAGSDFLLMPSLFEPCGLSQLIAFRYATIPIAYRTGGLIDTIIPFDSEKGNGNGILFGWHDVSSLVWGVRTARDLYYEEPRLKELRENAMSVRFSWEKSAGKYYEIYKWLSSE
jgi:starch synthase